MASQVKYNALIRSLPRQNSGDQVIGKVLLKDLNLIPARWTLLFRGEHLSRAVDITKLLCSPEDPIVIYKEPLKPPTSTHLIEIDCLAIPGFEGNRKMAVEMKPDDSVEDLKRRIVTKLGNPNVEIKLLYNKKVMKNDELLKDYKLWNDGCVVHAKIDDELPTSCTNVINETYKRYDYEAEGENIRKEDKDTIEDTILFLNTTLKDIHKEEGTERKRVIKTKSCATVGTLKRRICEVFKVNHNLHKIRYEDYDETLSDSEELDNCSLYLKGIRICKAGVPSTQPSYVLSCDEEESSSCEDPNELIPHMKVTGEVPRKKRITSGSEPQFKCWASIYCLGGGTPRVNIVDNRWTHATLTFQDVDRTGLTLEGEEPIHDWNLYSFGMTLYGKCPNEICRSKETKHNNTNGVSHIAGYGNILLTPDRFKFPCPACLTMFPGKEFVLCGGRALFRFKKSGIGQPVKTIVLESEMNLMKYKTFDKVGKGKKVKLSTYDFIEITTVKLWEGLYHCVECDMEIEYKIDENILRCGHAYHNECSPVNVGFGGKDDEDDDSIVGCLACNAAEVPVHEMLGMATVNANSAEAACVRPRRLI